MDTITSSVFVIPIGLGAMYILIDESTNPIYVHLLMGWTLMYFLIDFCLLLKKKFTPVPAGLTVKELEAIRRNEHPSFFIHHAIGITSILLYYYFNGLFQKYLLGYLTYELSTPFLNLSMYYNKHQINNLISKMVQIIFVLLYTIIRICYGTYMLIGMFNDVYVFSFSKAFVLMMLPILLQILNYIWYVKIVRHALKQFFPKGSSKKTN
jgi:hypothetical protein